MFEPPQLHQIQILRDPRQAVLPQGCLPRRLFNPDSLFGTLWEATRSSVAVKPRGIRSSE